MKLDRLAYEPNPVADFFEQGLTRLGAVCERTWHNRIELLAEGAAARLWSAEGELQAVELRFPEADREGLPDAGSDVFPGCPLTFRLCEMLWRQLAAELKVTAAAGAAEAEKAPAREVAEKTWRQQRPHSSHTSFGPFSRTWHFTLVASQRCEVQAIEQHWFAHRVALAWPAGERDLWMERNLEQLEPVNFQMALPPCWPTTDSPRAGPLIRDRVMEDLAGELAAITARQQHYLERELNRIDDYFAEYLRELQQRARRRTAVGSGARYEERLKAAAEEHERRRDDQVKRHEISIAPHLDALLWIAEPAWSSTVAWREGREEHSRPATYLSRLRQWFLER